MYPQVFADYETTRETYSNLTPLPTTAFFYGLHVGEEVTVEIDPGKVLFIKLISIGEPNVEGIRTLFYELNGMPREAQVVDRSLKIVTVARLKGDPNDRSQACAPMPGLVTELHVAIGDKVAEGDKLLTLEAMKMLTSVGANQAGTVKEFHVAKGDAVESDDLLVVIE